MIGGILGADTGRGEGLEPAPAFLLDATLGRLAKWLRLLGYDTAWERGHGQDRLLHRAEHEGRLLLTRDTRLVQRRAIRRGLVKAVLVRDDHVEQQLMQLRRELGVGVQGPPRCLVCNGGLRPVSRPMVEGRVPPYVFETQQEFRYCATCDHVTWAATHWKHVQKTIDALGLRRNV